MKVQKSNMIPFLLKPSLINPTLLFIYPKLFPYKYRNALPLFQMVFFDSRIHE